MKTYVDHLKSTSNFFEKKNIIQKPVLRSSAIFPFLIHKKMDTKVLFLSYWFLKRRIKNLYFLLTIRSEKGDILLRNSLDINKVKAYSISIKEFLKKKKISFKDKFKGSVELEVFSTQNLYYPFPAFVVNYVNNSSSFVHTCGRTFNDIDDQKTTLKFLTPETGFDIYPNKNLDPFFSFVNGNTETINSKINVEILLDKNKKIKKNFFFKKINPYETKFIFFLNNYEKKKIKYKTTLRIKHNFSSFFPRFLSGNIEKNLASSSITHSYYDLEKLRENKHFWINPNKKKYFDSMIAIPVFDLNTYHNELAVYPNFYFKKKITFNLEIFDNEGFLVKKKIKFYNIDKKMNFPDYINLNEIISDLSINKNKYYFARVTFNTESIPPRLKLGLNISYKNTSLTNLSSNVCFNAMVPDNTTILKTGTFKWAPIINKKNSKFIIFNMSNLKKGFKKANLTIKFWREDDSNYIKRLIKLNDNGSFCFELNNDNVIKKFLKKKTGWITISSDNPFINGFYFEENNKNNIGADHFF